MIVWRGRGFWVGAVGFGCLVGSELLTRHLFHDDSYYQTHGWPKLLGFLAAAGIVWRMSHGEANEYAVPQQVSEEPFLRGQDTFLHIPVRHWPAILCILGVVFFFAKS